MFVLSQGSKHEWVKMTSHCDRAFIFFVSANISLPQKTVRCTNPVMPRTAQKQLQEKPIKFIFSHHGRNRGERYLREEGHRGGGVGAVGEILFIRFIPRLWPNQLTYRFGFL